MSVLGVAVPGGGGGAWGLLTHALEFLIKHMSTLYSTGRGS